MSHDPTTETSKVFYALSRPTSRKFWSFGRCILTTLREGVGPGQDTNLRPAQNLSIMGEIGNGDKSNGQKLPSDLNRSGGGHHASWLLGARLVGPAAICHAHSNQDLRPHVHIDACNATHPDLAAGADIDARAHDPAAEPNGAGSAYVHTATADRHLCSAATGPDGHAQAATTHQNAAASL